jgi:hydroxyacylglutathione hydrolase
VQDALGRRGLQLRGILATHHHTDHVGGIDRLQREDVWVGAHASDRNRVPGQSVYVEAPVGRFVASGLLVAGRPVLAMHIPGHTRGAIAWGLAAEGEDAPTDVFTGDTLFAAGCGRLFEGTPAQMFTSLKSLAALPESTRLWFGHEYTASNLRFAAVAEPDNRAVQERQAAAGTVTTPTTVALERATNPFVRAASVEELAARRTAKDNF